MGIHDCMRIENKRGSVHISQRKLSKAFLMCPLEHNVVICCLVSEKLSFCEWVLKEIEENEDFEFSKMAGTGTQ